MKDILDDLTYEESNPDPEYLIKSIAEQGYSLETSLADLIDNSISAQADKVEILIDPDKEPFMLFLTDNGKGMDEKSLKNNLRFPSRSMEVSRDKGDLGRFGLGLKTASFSQTRCFTVISRKEGTSKYNARTWDVDYLKRKKKWNIIVNSQAEIKNLLKEYQRLSKGYLNGYKNYEPNTIIVWKGLYKFESYLKSDNRSKALKQEITEVASEYLSLVFHRFLEKKKPLKIRINNIPIKPFNPFPDGKGIRTLGTNQKVFETDNVKIEGFVLPSKSLDESKEQSHWTLHNRSLMDMEGIYIYRSNRIILFGGWNGIIKKSPRLQLARLKVDIGNNNDHLFHLNVAKSSIVIPFELRISFLRYISELKKEAEKEYYNRTTVSIVGKKQNNMMLFNKMPTNKGMALIINPSFPLLKNLKESLDEIGNHRLDTILRMINIAINKIRQVHEIPEYIGSGEERRKTTFDISKAVQDLLDSGLTKDHIVEEILPNLGTSLNSLPDNVKQLLK